MPRFARASLLLPALLALVVPLRAQTTAPAPAAAATDSETPTPPKPRRDRAVSAGVAASLAAAMPKYNPPPKPKPEDEDIDLRDVDKPRNGIIRLPKYTVTEKKPPVFRERDLLTTFGFGELAKKRYLTGAYHALNSFYLPLFGQSPEAHALAMYAEDERLQNMADLKDAARTVSRSSAADAAAIREAADATYLRPADFGFSPNDLKRQ